MTSASAKSGSCFLLSCRNEERNAWCWFCCLSEGLRECLFTRGNPNFNEPLWSLVYCHATPGPLARKLQLLCTGMVVWFSRSVVSDSRDPKDCNLPGSSVPGILWARILEWVAIPFSRGSSRPRNQTLVSCIAGRFFINCAMREPLSPVNTIYWAHFRRFS